MTNHRFCKTQSKRSLLLVAPADAQLNSFDGTVTRSHSRHAELLAQVQRLRGEIYVEDGAISQSTLTADGRHLSAVDESSWHLLTVNNNGDVLGCTRFREHQPSASFNDLCLRDSGMAKCHVWGAKLRSSVSADISAARKLGFSYIEVGGWALAHELRGTSEALQSVLAIFAWSKAMGGAIGVSTATERNGSASILRRLGGSPMQWDGCALPPYYDEQYKCGMEVLRFDSRLPNPRYAGAIEDLQYRIANVEVVQAGNPVTHYPKLPFSFPDLLPQSWPEPFAIAC